MHILCSRRRGKPLVQDGNCFARAIVLRQRLRGHLVSRHVIRIVLSHLRELRQRSIVLPQAQMFHAQTVAGKGVCRVGFENFVECGNLVHLTMVRVQRPSWQASVPIRMKEMNDNVPPARTVTESQSERSEIVFPSDSNGIGNLFGGRLMQYIDLVAAMAASRHARAITITASMDHLDFVAPVKVGELLILKASVNRAYRTSMEVGVRVMVEDVRAQKLRHVSSAYLTFVAVDREGNKLLVPPVIPETEHQKRRYEDAARRREMRSEETQRKKELRSELAPDWHI